MAVVNNPFEGSFENLSTKAVQGTKKTVKTVVSDVKQQVTGQEGGSKPVQNVGFAEQLGLKSVAPQQKQDEDKKKQEQLVLARQNLQKMEDEIKRVREQKKKQEEDKKRQEKQQTEAKKTDEQKKKADPIWKKMLKGQMGSREGGKHVSG